MILFSLAALLAHSGTSSAFHDSSLHNPVGSRRATPVHAAAKPLPEIEELRESLASVKSLPRIIDDDPFGGKKDLLTVIEPRSRPTFRRLFTHETWKLHIGGSFQERWLRCILSTPISIIGRSVYKSVAALSLFSLFVSFARPRVMACQIASHQQLPLSICGNAIGLLLVFRTNDAYRRLEEARELWGRVVFLSREIVSISATAWSMGPPSVKGGGIGTPAVVAVSRYVVALAWSLRDELRDGNRRCDILRLLLPEAEAEWVSEQRSRPLAIHGRLRRLVQNEVFEGRLSGEVHLILEGYLRELALVMATCERIFTSPIPPTMSRHGMRSLTIWLLGLPIVLSGTVPAHVNMGWTATISFIYLGINELGVQVEQPFQIIPLWQLCQVVQKDVEELVLHQLEINMGSTMTADMEA